MTRTTIAGVILLGLLATSAHAQTPAGSAGLCVAIDDAHDTLSQADRTAARLLLEKQFALAGRRVEPPGCAVTYEVSHVRLGRTIFVTLSGPDGHREGTAVGLDDLPALYGQMVRSLVTGQPMTGLNNVDRTNVTMTQAAPKRVQADSFGYARLGYSGVVGGARYGGPSTGVGYRVELDSFGLDVSFFNLEHLARESYGAYGGVAGSLLKLEAFRFVNPVANATPYFGGGMSWGVTSFGGTSSYSSGSTYRTGWHGGGLQAELTAGYETARASSFRFFVQADAVLPLYKVTSETYTYGTSPSGYRSTQATSSDSRYAPSLVVSIGIGWQKGKRSR